MIGQQTGSDKRYFSDEIEALYRYTDVEKHTILIQLEYYDLINVYILRINSDHKEGLFAVFEISDIYILYSICTFFRDSELHTGDCYCVDETFVVDVTRKIWYWFSLRLCGGGKTGEEN